MTDYQSFNPSILTIAPQLYPDVDQSIATILFTTFTTPVTFTNQTSTRHYTISWVYDVIGDVTAFPSVDLPSSAPIEVFSTSLSSIAFNSSYSLIFNIFEDSHFDFLLLNLRTSNASLLSSGSALLLFILLLYYIIIDFI